MSETDIKTRVRDAVRLSELREIPKFIGFLSSHEVSEAKAAIGFKKHSFFGGYIGAERCLLGVLPDWCEGEEEFFPITPLTFRFREVDSLSHRDFLGALMALGIKRSAVGDILVGKGEAVVFLLSELADYVLSEIRQIGRVGVSVEIGMPNALPTLSGFLEGSATVASMRLDCVVSALSNKSRSSAAEMISLGFVTLNSSLAAKQTQMVSDGDILSLRGIGRFIICSSKERSKKGRIILRWKKYN